MATKKYIVTPGHEVIDQEGVTRTEGETFEMDDKHERVLPLLGSGYIKEAKE